jgi:ATP-dependent DNA helicase RecG
VDTGPVVILLANLSNQKMSFQFEALSGDQAEALLKAEETHFLDLKSVDISSSSLSKTVSAFANTSGGEIFVGIEEAVGAKGDIRIWRGFANQEAANSIIQMLEGMSPLGNHFELDFLSAEEHEGLVLHVTVLKTRQILTATNGKVYVRRGAQKLPLGGCCA